MPIHKFCFDTTEIFIKVDKFFNKTYGACKKLTHDKNIFLLKTAQHTFHPQIKGLHFNYRIPIYMD